MSTSNQPERKKFRVSLEDKVTGERFSLIVMANSTDEATHSLCGSLIGHDCRYNWRGSGPEYDDEPKKPDNAGPVVAIKTDREISGFGYEVQSAEGFYIGDICYALSEKVYHEVWGGSDYEDGAYTEPETGKRFAVAGTAHGDGGYKDNKGHLYGVDAGNIGIVPKELCESTEGGFYYACPGTAILVEDEGVFTIHLPDGEELTIDTNDDADEEDEEDDWMDNCESRSYDCDSCEKKERCPDKGLNGRPKWEEDEDGKLYRYDFGFNFNWLTCREENELTTVSLPAHSEKEARDKLDKLLGGYARARQIPIYLNNVEEYD